MPQKLSAMLCALGFAVVTLATAGYGDEAGASKHVWVPPVDVTQALKIKMETKATAELLKAADKQCFDAECHKQVEACRKTLATCVIAPSKESVHEQEMENN